MLDFRAKLRQQEEFFQIIRKFLRDRSFLEVQTAVLQERLIPELGIASFTAQNSSFRAGELRLIPSPELSMKRLLAQGAGSIFQISHAFRVEPELTDIHSYEFLMLEYYAVNSTSTANIHLTSDLLANLGFDIKDVKTYTMAEVFMEILNIDLPSSLLLGRQALQHIHQDLGLNYKESDSLELLFNRIFLTYIEPELRSFSFLFLCDYPQLIPCLARSREASPFLERWELYIGGIEVANCYQEENRLAKIEEYYRQFTDSPSVADQEFIKICSMIPACSGVAIGLDRLFMLLNDEESIKHSILHR